MAEIELSPGTLPPPACYSTEQARFDAYVAAIVATVSGGIQWQYDQVQPTELDLYWLRRDASGTYGRPVEPLKWSEDDGTWVRFKSQLVNTGSSGGVANAYTLTNTPAFTSPTAYRAGAVYIVTAAADNTGASTLNIDGLGAKPIVYTDGVTPVAQGDIKTGQQMVLIYDGTSFQLASTTANTASHGSSLITTTGAGNFTVPGGVFSIVVECVAGGGGGGYSAGCRGGGGGGYAYKRWSVTPGQVIPYTVGVGGTKGSNYATPDSTNGGDTTFNTTQQAIGGLNGDSGGGAGGVWLGGDYGFNGQPGTLTTAADNPGKYGGGKAAYGASFGGVWDGTTASSGYIGGGGCGDNDSGGSNQTSDGGSGIILIQW